MEDAPANGGSVTAGKGDNDADDAANTVQPKPSKLAPAVTTSGTASKKKKKGKK